MLPCGGIVEVDGTNRGAGRDVGRPGVIPGRGTAGTTTDGTDAPWPGCVTMGVGPSDEVGTLGMAAMVGGAAAAAAAAALAASSRCVLSNAYARLNSSAPAPSASSSSSSSSSS